jgi:hypothetical protein
MSTNSVNPSTHSEPATHPHHTTAALSRTRASVQAAVGTRGSIWRRSVVRAAWVYLLSRLCVMVGAAVVAAELRADVNRIEAGDFPLDAPFADPNVIDKPIPRSGGSLIIDVLTSWDGAWYMRLVRDGYPRQVRADVTYEVDDARAAFFPTYPGLVRVVDRVLPGGDTFAALATNLVLGAAAVLLVGVLARRLFDDEVGERSMMLMALFPGSFVLSFAYTEALLLVLAAGCLIALHRHAWVTAGVLAALGSATRPNGVALIAACAVAALIAVKSGRDRRALWAAALAPIGFVGFQLWLGAHTGESGVWFRVQTEAWGEGTSFGLTALRNTFDALRNPLTSPTDTITAVSVLTLGLLIWMAWKHRLPAAAAAYSVVVVALMLLPSTVTARPRFIYTAFPLLICAAVAFGRPRLRAAWPYAVGACCTGLTGLTALYGVLGAIP